MAMSDTGSSFAQWAELYHHHGDLPAAAEAGSPDVFAAGAGGAAVASPPTSGGSGGGSPTKAAAAQHQNQQLGVDGPRVGKPARRRSRASRRAPVTLLNTDTANFRAMVQQFTGIPAPPAGAFGGPPPVISFAGDYGFPPQSSAGGVMSFDHHQLHRPAPAAAPLQDQLLRRQQQYTGGAFGGGGGGYSGNGSMLPGGDLFASAEDRLLLQSIQQAAAHQMPHMPPASAGANGYFA
ncbi:unnamed protein product [Urochloa decumbens]|uniref:VQ domain-containing protein n=1 Tax=Urochloa decumbens TaxID=240449 RepID=A0ABC9E006_9POAL